MPRARGNQPMSSGSNHNQKASNKALPPKRNKQVKYQKYKKAGKEAQKRMDNKQSAAINQLSKQVFQLQMKSYGAIQQNLHSLARPLVPTSSTPLCLDLTDFTCERGNVPAGTFQTGCRVFQASPLPPLYVTASNWERNAVTIDNLYWKNQNADQPDTGKYLAMNATYFIEVKGRPNLDNTRIRFDVVAAKPNAILQPAIPGGTTATTGLVLPQSLQYLTHLASPHVNRINPIYFKKYFSKTVFINSTKADPSTKGTTANIQRFSFRISPNKIVEQVQTNPEVGFGAVVDENTGAVGLQAEEPLGNYGPRNVNPLQPLWLIVSSDDDIASVGDQVEVLMSRRVVWRDHIGGANL